MSIRDAAAAQSWARTWAGATRKAPTSSGTWEGWCLVFSRMAFNVAARYGSAIVAWNNAEHRHHVDRGSQVPAGVPVFWRGGRFGHVAVSIGGGWCVSTDAKRRGHADYVRIDDLSRRWGYELVGWTEDINGVRVHFPEHAIPPVPAFKAPATDQLPAAGAHPQRADVSLTKVAGQVWQDEHGKTTYVWDVVLIQAALQAWARYKGWTQWRVWHTGHWDDQTQAMYDAFQRYGLYYETANVNGLPGQHSLERLGTTTGVFDAVK